MFLATTRPPKRLQAPPSTARIVAGLAVNARELLRIQKRFVNALRARFVVDLLMNRRRIRRNQTTEREDASGMSRLLALVNAGEVQAVIIAKLDRLTRSVKDLCTLLERFTRSASGNARRSANARATP
jgi:hypothetical protein